MEKRILKLKAFIYQKFGLFLAQKEELNYIKSDKFWTDFERIYNDNRNDIEAKDVFGILIGSWEAHNKFYRSWKYLKKKSRFNKWAIIILILFGLSFIPLCSHARQIRVAVIDTGFDMATTLANRPELCSTGHKDYTGTSIYDTHGHGTHIASVIGKDLSQKDYCLIIYKYFGSDDDTKATINAFRDAINNKVDIINYSSNGLRANKEEENIIRKATKRGIIVNVAAGNEGINLDNTCISFPCCYNIKNMNCISNTNEKSNYGKKTIPINGNDILGIVPGNKYKKMSGSSQSTAIYTNLLIKRSK